MVQSAIAKTISKTTPISSSTTNVCQYYVSETNFLTLRLNKLNYENQKKGQVSLGRQITTNPRIHVEHFIAMQENGLINSIVLKINDSLFLTIDRSSTNAANDEMLLQLASNMADFLVTGVKNTDDGSQVSVQDDQMYINLFFKLINDRKASDAVMIMSDKNTKDDSIKQAWGVQFNNMSTVKVVSVEPNQKEAWTNTSRQYKVTIDVVMNPNSANELIPYYGYTNGQNIRYINLVKQGGGWKIDDIATGP
ncbi:MAG: hypothetical protein WCP03_03730, partial [Candidatus Saccharibacteria bacterium]